MAVPPLTLSVPFNEPIADQGTLFCNQMWQSYHQALVDQLAALQARVTTLEARLATAGIP